MKSILEKVTSITGREKGPTSIIIAGIHGDERCGVEAVSLLSPQIKIQRGKVFFVYGNPKAIKSNQRFTEANLNRMFKSGTLLSKDERKSYEYRRARFLKSYLKKATALLDIHASFTPRSKPFIICEPNAQKISKYLPTKLVVSGFDKVEPGGTDYYMNQIGRIGICVECGFLKDARAIEIAKENIIAFLKARGHIENKLKPQKQSHIRMDQLYITKINFTLNKKFADFEKVAKDTLIGYDGKSKVVARRAGIILFARNCAGATEEAFLFGKNAV